MHYIGPESSEEEAQEQQREHSTELPAVAGSLKIPSLPVVSHTEVWTPDYAVFI
jgi:sortase (surface protein transpeptidase)